LRANGVAKRERSRLEVVDDGAGMSEDTRARLLRCPDIPVLLCSGYSPEEMSDRFSSADMAHFLQKPYTLDAFRTHMQGVLEPCAPRTETR
jgi:hypothetical protein